MISQGVSNYCLYEGGDPNDLESYRCGVQQSLFATPINCENSAKNTAQSARCAFLVNGKNCVSWNAQSKAIAQYDAMMVGPNASRPDVTARKTVSETERAISDTERFIREGALK